MRSEILNEEHQLFQEMVRSFFKNEIVPNLHDWEKEGIVPRDIWLKAGENGLLGPDAPEEYGGGGIDDFRYNGIVIEESWRCGVSIGFSISNDLVIPYLLRYANEEQKGRWLPKLCSGEHVSALAMTEPIAGSDLANIRTTAMRKGDYYVVNGQKTFVTNGVLADIAIVAVKTDPNGGAKGMSLLVLEREMAGFDRGKPFEKIGQKSLDTTEFFFSDMKVQVGNLLGEEGKGFQYLMENLPQERMAIAVGAMAAVEAVLEYTIEYCHERKAFGQSIGSFQHSKFKLAEMKTEAEIGRVFIDDCILQLNGGTLTPEKAAMAKWWVTDLQIKVVDQCLQLHGGNGYMMEYPIAKAYTDARVQSIYGGTNEIMKEIIGRSLGF
ncbi:acyl-CoA dehydrogenase family protein [Caldithrix abyssi]|nr:acyl-CoA dehydrogenase family protein [Caldithrix abyssi]